MPPIATRTSSRRRRHYACERCRSQKLRCYFATRTSLACARCIQCNVECTGRGSSDQIQLPQGQNPGGSSLLHNLLVLRTQLTSLGDTPLRRAVAVGAYTWGEVEEMYTFFRTSNMSLLADMGDWGSIVEIDTKFPQFAIAIVSVVAMSISLPEVQKQHSREFFLGEIWEHVRSENSWDTFCALAVICGYRLPYAELGISHLYTLNGIMAALSASLTDAQVELMRKTCISVTIPYAFLDSFVPIAGLIPVEHPLLDNDSVSSQVLQAYYNFRKCVRDINEAHSPSEAIEKYEKSMTIIFTSMAYNYEIGALRFLFFLVKLKLMKSVAVKVATSSQHDKLERQNLRFLERVVAESNVLGHQIARIFGRHASHSSIFPTFTLFLIEDCLVNFLAMRFVSFAAKIDVDVRTDDFLKKIETVWSDLSQRSSTARQCFVSFINVRILSGLKIGILNRSTGIVGGSGIMPYFEIYIEAPESRSLELAGRFTSLEAHEILCSVISVPENEIPPINDSSCFTDKGRSVLREILRVYTI